MKRATGKYAYGFCDRTGFRYPLHDLVEEYEQGRPTGLLVGRDMADPDHPQNWLGRLEHYEDPQALESPRPDPGQTESRRMSSLAPVGVGNMAMTGESGGNISTKRATAS